MKLPTPAARAALARALRTVQGRAREAPEGLAVVAVNVNTEQLHAELRAPVVLAERVTVDVLPRDDGLALVEQYAPGLRRALDAPAGDAMVWCLLLDGRHAWIVPIVAVPIVAVPTTRGSRARN